MSKKTFLNVLNESYNADEQKITRFCWAQPLTKRFLAIKSCLEYPENTISYWLKKDVKEFKKNKIVEIWGKR